MPTHNHIILPSQTRSRFDYTSTRSGGGTSRIPERDRQQYAEYLSRKFDEVWRNQRTVQEERAAVALPTRNGTYIEFMGQADHDLEIASLEDQTAGIRLLNVREIEVNQTIQQAATVFVPAGKEGKFARKLEDYRTKQTISGKPSHDKLFRSIEDLRIANLHALWTSREDQFPTEVISWYEVWIRTAVSDDKGLAQCVIFRESLLNCGVEVKENFILFHERAVLLVRANLPILTDLLARYDCLAEFRYASTPASFWCNESSREQTEWVEDLLGRLQIEQNHDVLICMLDSGINNGHPLLNPLIPDENCLTSIMGAGEHDPGDGHGTQMAGIIEYENIGEKLESRHPVVVNNRLCSIKILPNTGNNPKDLYGPITEQSVSRAEIAFPQDRKLYCMAVTAANSDAGLPTSWSGAVDQLIYNNGVDARLMIVSAGNIDYEPINFPIWNNYPDGSALRPVQEPAQSWNALTIGAYTELIAPGERPEYGRLAAVGEISPYSTTSSNWASTSPVKPEIVFEGGNLFVTNDPDVPYTPAEELEVLTTNARFRHLKPLATFSATSLATAIASSKASKLMQKYPDLWAESVRALMVHSAEWTEAMCRQFPANSKTELRKRLRSVGYGVPNESRLMNSLDNALTMITQAELQPFIKRGSAQPVMHEMHLINLPWPSEILTDLAETTARIKITLSYFIEPGPGEIGWKNKYRYQSCGLRFELNDVNEDLETFKQRINKRMRDDENPQNIHADSSRWKIGSNNRDVGSIHSDFIEDSAINLAGCKYIAVYPVGGWWKLRTNLKMYNKRVRYSLVVSLETPEQNVDIYSPVAIEIANMVLVPIEIPMGNI